MKHYGQFHICQIYCATINGVSWGSIEQFPRNLNKSGGKFMKGRELEKIRILINNYDNNFKKNFATTAEKITLTRPRFPTGEQRE